MFLVYARHFKNVNFNSKCAFTLVFRQIICQIALYIEQKIVIYYKIHITFADHNCYERYISTTQSSIYRHRRIAH